MNRLARWLDQVRHGITRKSDRGDSGAVVLTQEDLDAIEHYFRLRAQEGQPISVGGRAPTDEEVAQAAWANLVVETPDVTIEDARRAVARLRAEGLRQATALGERTAGHV